MSFCHASKTLPDVDVWRSAHALDNSGCPDDTLNSICTATINHPATLSEGSSKADIRAGALLDGCNGADVAVIATQEMTNLWGDIFPSILDHRMLAERNYVEVGRCGARISTGVVVLVKESLRVYFAPNSGAASTSSATKHGQT